MSTQRTGAATAVAPANIALVKYWGNLDAGLRLPWNGSLSFTLDTATTTTSVAFDQSAAEDRLLLDGEERHGPALERVSRHLDIVRELSGTVHRAQVVSTNSFPMGTGVASSASAFAALSLAASAAAGLELGERALSTLARRGSGSASRSVPDGFVVWHGGSSDAASYAESFAPPEHWALVDVIAIVSRRPKQVSSGGGHERAPSSPLFAERQRRIGGRLTRVRRAVEARDLSALGPEVETEALELHAVAMTSAEPVLYWEPGTVDLLRRCPAWRKAGLPVYFTLDAGPNVHLLCEEPHVDELVAELRLLSAVQDVLISRPGPGARLLAASD